MQNVVPYKEIPSLRFSLLFLSPRQAAPPSPKHNKSVFPLLCFGFSSFSFYDMARKNEKGKKRAAVSNCRLQVLVLMPVDLHPHIIPTTVRG